MFSIIRSAAFFLTLFTVLTGVLYPLTVTAIAQLVFPHQSNGSLLKVGDHIVGSRLIGQHFEDPRYFWGRPSATTPLPNNAAASSGSNLGPTNRALIESVKERIRKFSTNEKIPVELLTTSASGLDPEISLAAAYFQVSRVAKARGLSPEVLNTLVEKHIRRRDFGILGEARVNILLLNLALDGTSVTHI